MRAGLFAALACVLAAAQCCSAHSRRLHRLNVYRLKGGGLRPGTWDSESTPPVFRSSAEAIQVTAIVTDADGNARGAGTRRPETVPAAADAS
jgi:hypothetical protein